MKTETRWLVINSIFTLIFAILIGVNPNGNQSKITSTIVSSEVKLTNGVSNIRLVKDQTQLDELKSIQKELVNQDMVIEPKEETITVDIIIEEQPEVFVEIPSSNPTLGREVVEFAKQFVGNPYVYGGTSLTNGADCSGFVQSVLANFGISVNRSSYDQVNNGVAVSLDNIQPGDIVLYGYNGQISHSSLYIGNNQIVHAMNSDSGIVISNYTIMPIIAVRRVL